MARTELEQLVYQMDVNVTKMNKKLAKMDGDTVKQVKKTQSDFDKLGSGIGNSLGGAIDGVAGQIPVLSDGLSALGGVAGGAALVGLAALAFGLNQAKEAMLWSAEVTDLSEKLGITAEALQKLEFAADESGVPIEELHSALGNLNASLGAIKSGVGDAKIKKVFEALGLTKADVAGVHTSAEFIPILADRISKLGSVAEQVKIAKSLGVESLVPLLARGAGGVAALTTEAERLGLVIDNQTVKSLDEMNRQVEIAQQRIDVGLKRAFLDLAPAIANSTNAMADFIDAVNKPASQQSGFMKAWSIMTGQAVFESVFGGSGSASGGTGGGGRRGNPAAVRDAARQTALMRELMNRPTGGGSGAASTGTKKTTAYTGPLAAGADNANWDLSAAGYQVADSFIKAKDAYDEFGSAIVEFKPGVEVIDQYEGVVSVLGDVAFALGDVIAYGDDLGDTLSDVARRIVSSWATSGLLGIFGIDAQGKATGGGILDVLKGKNSGPGGFAPSGGGGIWDILKGLPSLGGIFGGSFPKIPGFATGTRNAPGGLAYVHKDELINLPKGSQVYTANETRGILAGAQASRSPVVYQTFQVNAQGSILAADIVAEIRATGNQAAMTGAVGGAQLSRAQAAKTQRNTLR